MTVITLILPYALLAAALVQGCFWVFVFSRLAFYKVPVSTPAAEQEPSVSIIICARNEAENLQKNLDHIVNQNYRSFEVLVINDQSSDHSEEILTYYKKKYTNFGFSNITYKSKSGKKEALTKGLMTARYEVVILTDADCRPSSPDWIRLMVQSLQGSKTVGLGFGPYSTYPGFLNKWIRFEAIYTAIQYLSLALCGLPYMGVGRNLIYHKKLFFEAGGFRQHEHLASGDDDLFINAVARKDNTAIVIDPSSFVYSEPKIDLKSYYHQKSRHYTTGTSYKPLHQFLLGFLALSHFFYFFFSFLLLILKVSTVFVLQLFIIRTMVLLIIYGFILRKLKDLALLPWVVLLDALFPIYYAILSHALFRNNNPWK